MKDKMLFALAGILAVTVVVVLIQNSFATPQDTQYAYQVNIHENIDASNPVKTNIYIPGKATAIMKLETERYQMYGTVSYIDDIRDGNHDHIMFNEITKWNYPKYLGVKVNDKDVIVYLEEKLDTELGLTPYLKPGWNTIEFYSESDGRINASIFVQIK